MTILTTCRKDPQDHTIIFTANSMDRIINHLGGLPTSFTTKHTYSEHPITRMQAERIVKSSTSESIFTHINLIK